MTKYFSPTEMDVAFDSVMQWHLRFNEGMRISRVSYFEKGFIVHKLIDNFWDSNKLGRKYKSAEKFAAYAKGKWLSHVIGVERSAEKGKEPIDWRTEDEKWKMASQIYNLAIPLFYKLIEWGPPIYPELKFKCELELIGLTNTGLGLKGRLDEVRKEDDLILVRDYKTGRSMRRRDIEHGTQSVIYPVGLMLRALESQEVAEKLSLSEREIRHLLLNLNELYQRVQFEYVLLERKGFYLDSETEDVNEEKAIKQLEFIRKHPSIKDMRLAAE